MTKAAKNLETISSKKTVARKQRTISQVLTARLTLFCGILWFLPGLFFLLIVQMHHRNVNDRKNTIKNIKRLIRRKEKDNEQLDADLEELALSVAERRNVNEANGMWKVC